jgi:hypothetical protein
MSGGLNNLHSIKLEYLVQLDDTGVADKFKDVDFSRYSLNISHVNNLFFYQDLDGHFFAGQSMGSQLNFAEGALSNRFT